LPFRLAENCLLSRTFPVPDAVGNNLLKLCPQHINPISRDCLLFRENPDLHWKLLIPSVLLPFGCLPENLSVNQSYNSTCVLYAYHPLYHVTVGWWQILGSNF
jgi:hypothetical protein